ncbi:ImmA/IrrE family metallo-endopeptidase [Terribacillus sp. 179-K 1B1 HS]|uniref:ImmA/IrrE family metallo-endopeptidase n=1 Tax=Terribacillus sp. 179-K 1B1 HS TaxID=3142388 RepID=UPI00399EE940
MKIVYSHSNIEGNVRDLYHKLEIREPHQIDRFEISRKLNIDLQCSDKGSLAFRLDGLEFVILNRNLTEQQLHAEFFHELAHIRTHTGSQHRLPKFMKDYQEWRAELFMLHCLAPTDMLIRDNLPGTEKEALYLMCERYNICEEHARKRYRMFFR